MQKRVFITKAMAAQIAGSDERFAQITESMHCHQGQMWVLFTGANLFQINHGRVPRFGISGFSQDGSDISRVLKALAAGDRCLLLGHKHIQSPNGNENTSAQQDNSKSSRPLP